MTLSDLVAVLNEGALQQCVAPREVYDRPANLFVARFVGSPPINLLRARVTDGTLRCPAGSLALEPETAPARRSRGRRRA
jgi:multiple sugar transport system ATP-binding protein